MKKETQLSHMHRTVKEFRNMPNVPIYQASSVLFDDLAHLENAETQHHHHDVKYGKYGVHTQFHLETCISSLEGGDYTWLTSCGASAIFMALISTLQQGDHLLMVDTAYYPTREYCEDFLSKLGIDTTYYPADCGENIRDYIRPDTKVLYMESPGTSTFDIQDISTLCKIAKEYNIITMVDNTWATGLYFNVFDHGADVSIVAITKYIGGHSDIMMGSVTCKKEHFDMFQDGYKFTAATVSPHAAYQAQRGLRTLKLRYEKSFQSSLTVGTRLKAHPKISEVLHPGLKHDPNHAQWKEQYNGGGAGLLSIILDAAYSQNELQAMMDALDYFNIAYSWGGYESLILPFDTNYRTCTPWPHGDRSAIRLYIGLEDPSDLIEDLERGLAALPTK